MRNLKTYSTLELKEMQSNLQNRKEELDFRESADLRELNKNLLYKTRKNCNHHWSHFGTSMGRSRQAPKQEFVCRKCEVHGLMTYNEVYRETGVRAKYIK